MIAKLLSEALAILKTTAAEIGVSLDDLTATQIEKHNQDCFDQKRLTNARLQHKNTASNSQPRQ